MFHTAHCTRSRKKEKNEIKKKKKIEKKRKNKIYTLAGRGSEGSQKRKTSVWTFMKIQRVLTIWSAYPSTAKGKRKINGVVSLGPRIPQKNIKNKICRPVNSNFRASHEILVHTMFAPNVSYRPRPVPTKYSRTIKQMSSYGCFRVSSVLFR